MTALIDYGPDPVNPAIRRLLELVEAGSGTSSTLPVVTGHGPDYLDIRLADGSAWTVVATTAWTPYADGTSGHQGGTSQAAEPRRRKNVPTALAHVAARGTVGITWRELAERTGWHHGQASGALSNLHRSGQVMRLALTRRGSGVYVTPNNALDRATAPYRSNRRVEPADPA